MIGKIKTAIKLGPLGVIKKLFSGKAKKRYLYFGNLTDSQLASQRKSKMKAKISVVVPCFNTPPAYLCELINSCIKNSYQNFELILADASADDRLKDTVASFSDKRIVYKKLEANTGISGNTNRALETISGDVIIFCDHDDILMPDAFFEVARGYESGADFIYSDMDRIDGDYKTRFDPYFKGSFGPDTLRSSNYICHLFAISRELYEKVGELNPAFDGSQDYDYILRCSEKCKKPYKIDRILYCWRVHENSVASDISAKPYAVTAAENSILAHIERQSVKAKLSSPLVAGSYKFSLPTDFNITVLTDGIYEDYYKSGSENAKELLLVLQKGVIIDKQSVLELAMLLNFDTTRYVVPKILNSSGKIVCSGYCADERWLHPLFRGYPEQHNGYANRNLTINNIDGFSTLCYMMRAEDKIIENVADSFKETAMEGYAVFNPYAKAYCDIELDSIEQNEVSSSLNRNLAIKNYDIIVKEGII